MSSALSRVCQWFFPTTVHSSELWVEMKTEEERVREELEQKQNDLQELIENYEMLSIFNRQAGTPSDCELDQQWQFIVTFASKNPSMPVPQKPEF